MNTDNFKVGDLIRLQKNATKKYTCTTHEKICKIIQICEYGEAIVKIHKGICSCEDIGGCDGCHIELKYFDKEPTTWKERLGGTK